MKKQKMLVKVLAVLLVMSMVMAVPAAAADTPAIVNGGFEELNEDGKATGWSFTAGAETVTGDTAGAYSGNYVKLTGPDQHVIGTVVSGLTAGKTYVLSFALKSQDQNVAMLSLEYVNSSEENAKVDGENNSSLPVTNGSWRKVTHTFTLAEGADALRISLRTLGSAYFPVDTSAYVCYDDVALEERGQELVMNGDMETTTNGVLDYWNLSDSAKITADVENADGGRQTMKLTGTEGKKETAIGLVSDAKTVKEGSEYILSARVNIPENLVETPNANEVDETTGFRIYARWKNDDTKVFSVFGGRVSNNTAAGYRTAKTDGYITYSQVVGNRHHYSGSDVGFEIVIELNGAGTVYVDNVSVRPTGEEIYDGGFEDAYGGDVYYLSGAWYRTDADAFKRDTTMKYSGKASLCATPSTAVKEMLYLLTGLDAAAAIYRLDYMYYATETSANLKISNSNLNNYREYAFDFGDGSTAMQYEKWTRARKYVYKPAGETTLKIRFYMDANESGTSIYIDDVSLQKDESTLECTRTTDTAAGVPTTMENATHVRYHYVTSESVENENLPKLIIAKYTKENGFSRLSGIEIKETVKELWVNDGANYWPEATYPRFWHGYDYTYTFPAERDEATTYKAFVWDSFSGLTPLEKAIVTVG